MFAIRWQLGPQKILPPTTNKIITINTILYVIVVTYIPAELDSRSIATRYHNIYLSVYYKNTVTLLLIFCLGFQRKGCRNVSNINPLQSCDLEAALDRTSESVREIG